MTTTTAAPVFPPTPMGTALDQVMFNTNSCLVVRDATTHKVIYDHNGSVPFAPASTQKLLVAAAALDRLGPDYRFVTSLVSESAPVGGQVGNLWLVGGGDPLLATAEYATHLAQRPATAAYATTPISALADALVAKGVRSVRNGVHADDSRYSTLRYLPTWVPNLNQGEFDVGPIGALEVDQGLDSWGPAKITADPAAHGAGVVARLLAERGVAAAPGGDSTAPAGAVVLARIPSVPLAQIVTAMLQGSDNQIAEMLVRELDRKAGGSGTTAGGVAQVMAAAARLGLPVSGLSMVDGSGLSPTNRVTCRTLLGALELGDTARLSALTAALPVAGVSGLMYDFFRGTPLAGRLAAKGGYITGVAGLVGRLSGGATPVHFAFVSNGDLPFGVGLGMEKHIVEALATG